MVGATQDHDDPLAMHATAEPCSHCTIGCPPLTHHHSHATCALEHSQLLVRVSSPILTYFDQKISPTLCMFLPDGLDHCCILMKYVSWSVDTYLVGDRTVVHDNSLVPFNPRCHCKLDSAGQHLTSNVVQMRLRLKAITCRSKTDNSRPLLSLDEVYLTRSKFIHGILGVEKLVSMYQSRLLKLWNPAHVAVGEFYWPAICLRKELSMDQAVLVMVVIFKELGLHTLCCGRWQARGKKTTSRW